MFLGRRADEPLDRDLHDFYTKLLEAVNRPVFRYGQWSLCERTGWPDNLTFQNLVAWSWSDADEHLLIVVNLSDFPAQARVKFRCDAPSDGMWQLADMLAGGTYERDGNEMGFPGLYVELGPWNYHFFQCLAPKVS